MAVFKDVFPIVYTEDVDGLAKFYTEAFGFEVAYRWPADPNEPMEFGQLALGGSALGLARPVDPLHGRPVAAAANPNTFELCIETEDVDGTVARLRELGTAILHEPADQPWGERLAYVADPDGHPIMLYSKIA